MRIITAERIRTLRELHHYKQVELANQLKVSRNCVNSWEMGLTYPSTKMLIKLATQLHTSIDYLLGIETKECVDISNCSIKEKEFIYQLLDIFQENKK